MDGDRSLAGVLPRKAEGEVRPGHQDSLKGTDGALVSGCMAGICFALLIIYMCVKCVICLNQTLYIKMCFNSLRWREWRNPV